jgi:glycosyltransferase involved in cell wall biosynthesis
LSNHLKLVVDGVIYQYQATGGISRLFTETLPRICTLDEAVRMTLFTTGLLIQEPPSHPHIRHVKIGDPGPHLRPATMWPPFMTRVKRIWFGSLVGSGRGRIWHSTYFTRPPQTWKGLQAVTVPDMIYERFPDLFTGEGSDRFREERKQCVLAADAVLCISEATRRDVQEFYGVNEDRLHVVHLACSDVFRPLPAREGDAGTPFFLYVGSRAHYKNFQGLLDAYSKWSDRSGVKLLVVGPAWTTEEGRRLDELGISGRVEVLTDVRDEALCVLYNQATAFIYPSLYEGFGIPLLEAMACGCPVIASRIPSTVEIAGDCPIYFETHQPDSLLEALDTAVTEGRDSMRARMGLKHVERFSWKKSALGTLKVYRSMS